MHIELTEMLRCPEPHREEFLVLSTGEMGGRMVRTGVVGCPVCRREYEIVKGVVYFTGSVKRALTPVPPLRIAERGPGGEARFPLPVDPQTLQALLDLGGPGGFVVLVGAAARHAVGLAALMGGIHFVGVNAPAGVEELPVLSLLRSADAIPLRSAFARGVVLGSAHAGSDWLAEGHRILLRGRRLVAEREDPEPPPGIARLASADGLWVGEKR